jgi:hypothetical protein
LKKGIVMLRTSKLLIVSALLLGIAHQPAASAEREQVRIVIAMMAAVKMPYPENLGRNRAKTQRVWLEQTGHATVACLREGDRRWCYEHIPAIGARPEMLRIRSEPPGLAVNSLWHYIDDYDLDGMIDLGSTTRIEQVGTQPPELIGHVIKFFHRSTGRGPENQAEFQKIYDDGIQIALKVLGE